jgi:general secretion pathway protein J
MRAKIKRGFTLVELLVAISVLAIVAVLGWRGLDSIVRARVSLNSDLAQTRGLQLAFAQMQSDSAQIATSGIIGRRPPVMADAGKLTMVRMVFAENQPSRLQVVSYRLRDGLLTRRESAATRNLTELDAFWTAALADTDGTQPVVLQSGVNEMKIRSWVLGPERPGWRDGANGTPLPGTPIGIESLTGLEVALRLQDRPGELVKVFLLGAA